MKLHNLPKTTDKEKKRIGRGYGSGKGGHTTIRGQKGQKARSKLPLWFGGLSSWILRLPMLRGKGKFKSYKKPTQIITLNDLNQFKDDQTVDADALVKKGIISEREKQTKNLKVLNNGKLKKKVKLDLPASKSVIKTVKKIGGEYISEAD